MMKTLLASAAAVALSAGMAVADYKITILHTDDFHARFEPVSKYDSGYTMLRASGRNPSFPITIVLS